TGVEALYADLGHFGRRPIRLAWGCIALPALLLNYFGQGAHLLAHPEAADHIFYALVPTWGRVPMVVLATVATIIASQAVITGAFSLTRQAIQLGLFPRFRVIHTSARRIGQIYVPPVNWALMICTLALVVAFGQSSKLAAAYGVAVNLTMLVSSILFFVVARCVWRWRWWAALPAAAVFITVDLAFFTANLSKVMHGAWFPLVVAAVVFSLMATWRRGRELLGAQIRERLVSWDAFRARLAADPPPRVAGSAIFLTGNPDTVPVALLHNLEHNKVLHSRIALLHFVPRETPYVEEKDRVRVVAMGENMTRIIADYGYMEEPSVRQTLARARELGVDFDPTATSFFLGREKLSHGPGSPFGPVRHLLFGFLTLFSTDAATYFEIPLSQVIEVGISLEL
ncbi:MAG TPA: KUP/HAK/KT family potassium transporter, partial [Candidatus Sumerlaeota bacterium]|nr:KUP/HAK/KT family potassium transporter [Candidatus Sumerlaeota bacterium]